MREALVFGYCFRMKSIWPDSIGLNPTKFDELCALFDFGIFPTFELLDLKS